jgi:hypothetical protein
MARSSSAASRVNRILARSPPVLVSVVCVRSTVACCVVCPVPTSLPCPVLLSLAHHPPLYYMPSLALPLPLRIHPRVVVVLNCPCPDYRHGDRAPCLLAPASPRPMSPPSTCPACLRRPLIPSTWPTPLITLRSSLSALRNPPCLPCLPCAISLLY